jgi:hypothetical protein
MKYLISCNHQQAEYHAKALGLSREEYRVITHSDQLRGLRFNYEDIIKVGEYYENKDLDRIEEQIKIRIN